MSNFLDDLLDESTASKWIEQGTEEWDKIRVGRFTSSEIWRLMVEPKTNADKESGKLSETAMTYVTEKVSEVLTGQNKSQGYAYPLVYGKEMEPQAIEYFQKVTGLTHETVGFFPMGDHAGGSPDGFIGDDDILEVKCPYDQAKQLDYLMLTDQWDLLRNFREYYWQCMANLLFTGKKRCHFATYDPRYIDDKFKMTHLIIEPKEEHFDMLIKKIEKGVEEKLKLIKLFNS